MSPEAQRIGIAEACGWVWYRIPLKPNPGSQRVYRCLFLPAVHEYEGQDERWLVPADGSERICNMDYMAREGHVPDYLNDLNACYEMENTMSGEQARNYHNQLGRMAAGGAWIWHATAAQRAEAFLRVLNLWKD